MKNNGSGNPPHNPVSHPAHYTGHASGIECIQVAEHMNFNLGNALKYIWRHEAKNGIEDLQKAVWYVEREIQRQRVEQAMTTLAANGGRRS